MKRLCSICARGGSQGVKGKNLRPLLAKPLISYSIEQAQNSGLFDAIAVSSDSSEILDVARQYGVKILINRDADLASHTAAKLPAIKNCAAEAEKITNLKFDTFVDLDCTSPLREVEDINAVTAMVEETDCDNVITAMPSRRSPYFNMVELNRDGFVEISKKLPSEVVRRQDSPQCFDMNGSIYAWKREAFWKNPSVFSDRTKLYVMPDERSIDIDTELDFEIVTLLMRKKFSQNIS